MKSTRFYNTIFLVAVLAVVFLPLTGCVSALTQTRVEEGAISTGTYTVILYRGYGYRDLDSAAFLDKEGDGFSLARNGSETGVIRIQNLDGAHAVQEAEQFLGHHADFDYAQIQALTTSDGTLVGYEIRPIFRTTDASGADPLQITYAAAGNRYLFTVDFRFPPEDPNDRMRR